MKKVMEICKVSGEAAKIIITIFTFFSILGGGIIKLNNAINNVGEDLKAAAKAAVQAEANRLAIEEIKEKYTPLSWHDEHTKFIVTQIDLEIDETMSRVAEGKYIGTRYVNTLRYYYNTLTFLSSKQKSMIETILRYYERQERRRNDPVGLKE